MTLPFVGGFAPGLDLRLDALGLDVCLDLAARAAILAQQAPAGPQQPAPNDGWTSMLTSLGPMLPILVIGVLFYFLMLQPERKKQGEQKKMLADLKTNDRVVTIGGIIGVVSNISEKTVTLRVDEKSNAKVQVLRSAISRVLTGDEAVDGAT